MNVEIFPTNIMTENLIWSLFEMPVATAAGAWVYGEEKAYAPMETNA